MLQFFLQCPAWNQPCKINCITNHVNYRPQTRTPWRIRTRDPLWVPESGLRWGTKIHVKLRGHVPSTTHPAGTSTHVAGSENRVETEARDNDSQQGKTKPPHSELSIRVITGTYVIIWKSGSLVKLSLRYYFLN